MDTGKLFVADIADSLKKRGKTLAVAESCTGGRLAAAFTAEAGASEYFLGGVVAYANDVKTDVLGVEREVLERHGAVSSEIARQMAAGVRRITGADYAVANTGIAGPGGGTPEKPVGTVWIAVAGPDAGITARKMQFDGTRTRIMNQTVCTAVEMLRDMIIVKE